MSKEDDIAKAKAALEAAEAALLAAAAEVAPVLTDVVEPPAPPAPHEGPTEMNFNAAYGVLKPHGGAVAYVQDGYSFDFQGKRVY
jgi:hypothetical protein